MGSVHKCWYGVWTAIVVHAEMGDQGYMKQYLTKSLPMSCIDEECGIPRDFQLSVSFGKMQTMLMVQNPDFLYIVKEIFGEEIFEGWPEGDVEVPTVRWRL